MNAPAKLTAEEIRQADEQFWDQWRKDHATEALPDDAPLKPLLAAQAARRAAQAKVKESGAALERGRKAFADAEQELARFEDLDKRITSVRAEMVKADQSGPLPDALIAEREQRAAAREQRRQAKAVLEVLEKEHAAAQAALREAEEAVDHAGWDILALAVPRLAERLASTKRLVWDLETKLRALDPLLTQGQALGGKVPTWPGTLRGALALEPPQPTITGQHEPLALARKQWLRLHAKLVEGANK